LTHPQGGLTAARHALAELGQFARRSGLRRQTLTSTLAHLEVGEPAPSERLRAREWLVLPFALQGEWQHQRTGGTGSAAFT